MDLSVVREGLQEQKRIQSLMELIPRKQRGALLDVGTRDGYIAIKLSEFFERVTALDLEKPEIHHDKITAVQGNITALDFPDNAFDVVLCAEVLEHLPPAVLGKACHELTRVAKEFVVIGVPYKQDIRVGRTTCFSCGGKNPPYGHVNSFDEQVLTRLFPHLSCERMTFVGENTIQTNVLSTFLLDAAGNPYGTYSQEETCLQCGSQLTLPPPLNLSKRILTKIALLLNRAQSHFITPRADWIHLLFRKTKQRTVSYSVMGEEQSTPSATPTRVHP